MFVLVDVYFVPRKICLNPVGYVQTDAVGKEINNKTVVSKIVFDEEYLEALQGIEDFSHLFVIFWLHETSEKNRKNLKTHPCGRADLPLVGLFATCTPYRPNPIGLTRVKLLDVRGTVVTVQGLDAFDGTPVLDIKPFDHYEKTSDFKIADWWKQIIKRKKKEEKRLR